MTEKGRIQRSKFAKGNRDKSQAEENIRNYLPYIRNGNRMPKIQKYIT